MCHGFVHLARLGTIGAILVGAPWSAAAQGWPRSPVSLADGRVTLGGEFSATYGSEDPGYFNFTDYGTSALRRIRAGLTIGLTPSPRLAMLAEFRAETGGGAKAYAYYLRITPWPDRPFVVQAGRIPPVFGAFARHGYPQDNPLIGDPLAYQYLTSVRSDALPASASDVVRMRGRGWRVSYPVGNSTPKPGLPIIAGFDWDTGIQARLGLRPIEASASWTIGSLSTPGYADRPGHGTVAARVGLTPTAGVVIGASAARGTFVEQVAMDALPAASRTGGLQSAIGLDGEFARGYLLLRGELMVNRWQMPTSTGPALPLNVLAGYAEGRYRLRPDLYVATRVERLSFDGISTLIGTTAWEARVTRLEAGVGYSLTRRSRLKSCYQLNIRDGGRIRRSQLAAAQLVVWF